MCTVVAGAPRGRRADPGRHAHAAWGRAHGREAPAGRRAVDSGASGSHGSCLGHRRGVDRARSQPSVDLDDLLASSDLSFQLNLIHLLVERFHVRDYARRIGTNMDAAFPGSHAAGVAAETEHLRGVVGDPTIRFVYEETRPNNTLVFGYRSNEGYRIFHVFRHGSGALDGAAVRGGELFATMPDGRRLTIEQLVAARAAPGG